MLCMGATAMATNYYAAPGANGSGTSISDPGDLASLASSKSFAGGDSLFLMDGVYYTHSRRLELRSHRSIQYSITYATLLRRAMRVVWQAAKSIWTLPTMWPKC